MCGGPMSSPSSSPGGVLRCLGPESQLGASLDTDEPPCTSPPPIENFGPARSGLGACRDGKAAYLSLPSPNLQTEEQEGGIVFNKLPSKPDEEEDEQDEFVEPPASALHRRRALVPPKMMTDGYESSSEDVSSQGGAPNSGDQNTQKTRRRSSIVVIPPMQICPGDLLVYSKVLTHRNNLLDIDGSTQCLAVSDDSSRKGKNTWSLLRLFDRANRAKSECLGGLEEVLSTLRPSEFCDEQLSRYKGMQWADFMSSLKKKKKQGTDSNSSSSGGSSTVASPENSNGPSPLSGLQPGKLELNSPSEDALRNQFLKTINQTILKNETKKKEAMWDLFQSECMFLYDHLMVLKNVFMEPLKKIQVEGFAMFAEPEVLFGNLDELCCVTYAFCKEFISFIIASMNSGDFNTTDVLLKLFKKSTKATALRQAYHRYTLNYINALNYLETLRRQVEFNEFEKWCSRDPRCKKLQLTDLLVSPVQHIMRVPLILKDIEMRTEDVEERDSITAILEAEENSLRELDDKMKWLKNFERLLEIQRNIIWPSVTELDPKAFIPEFLKTPLAKQPCERLIVSPRRQIIYEGALQLLDSGKPSEVYVVLFDDMILITRRKKGLHKKGTWRNQHGHQPRDPQKSSITENWASTCSKGNSIHEGGFKYVVYKQPLSLDRICIHDVTVQDGSANNLKNAFVFVCLNRFQQIVTVHTFQAQNESGKLTWLTKLKDTVDRWKRTLQNTVFRNQRIPPSGGLK
uniref:Putative regulation of rho protein signal transduction n=2 Tax=Ixodes ricinus TaxID=34613 RepID=A0A6B0VFJ4_IXORI